MLLKAFDARIKAAGEKDGLEPGQFEAIVSVFGNKDSYGDIVMPGAFKDTLAQWKASGNPIPVYYSHRMDDPDFNIGYVLEAKEVKLDELGYAHPAGLWVKGALDTDEAKANKVYKLMKGGRITQFSFAYDVLDGGFAKRQIEGTDAEEEYYELRKLALYEVGPTPIGANQETELLGVKAFGEQMLRLADEVKSGRVLSAKNEGALRNALDGLKAATTAIDGVLATLGDDGGKNGDGSNTHAGANEGKAEDPVTGKAEDPVQPEPVDTKALADAAERISRLAQLG